MTRTLWRLDPVGRGALMGRMSSDEARGGEVMWNQIKPLLEMTAGNPNLIPGWLMTVENASGTTRFADRQDLVFVAELIRAGAIDWVAYRDIYRVARDRSTAAQFFELLEMLGIELWLCDKGSAVDLRNDRLQMDLLAVVAAEDRRKLVEDLARGKKRYWLESGRGWPSPPGFALLRDEDDYLAEDPEVWPQLETVFAEYLSFPATGRGHGLRPYQEYLSRQHSIDLSFGGIRRVLRDSRYVTGRFNQEVDGVVYPCRTKPLSRPIPARLFEQVQRLLDARKGVDPKADGPEFALKHVPIWHAACRGDAPGDRGGRLFGRWREADARPYYSHQRVTRSDCYGFLIPRAELERPVIEFLRFMRYPFMRATGYGTARPGRTYVCESDPGTIATLVEHHEHRCACLKAQYFAVDAVRGQAAAAPPVSVLEASLQHLDRLRHQLAVSEALAEILEACPYTEAELADAFDEIVAVDTPSDPTARKLRTEIIGRCLSAIIVSDTDDGTYDITLEGPLVPIDREILGPIFPIQRAQTILEEHLGERDPGVLRWMANLTGRTVSESSKYETVRTDVAALMYRHGQLGTADGEQAPSRMLEPAWVMPIEGVRFSPPPPSRRWASAEDDG